MRPANPVKKDLKTRLLPLKVWLRDHSALYFAVTHSVHQSTVLRDLAVNAGLIIPAERVGPAPTAVYNHPWDPRINEQTVAALQDLCAGYDCTVAIIPSRALWMGTDPQTEARVHEALVGTLRARGLTVVDPRSRMEAEGAPSTYVFPRDGHINQSGHALVAEMVVSEIIAKSASKKGSLISSLSR